MKLQVVGQPDIKQQWQGEWITHPKQDTIKNSWLCFRKTVYLPQKIQKKVFANISVDSKYWLMINNQLVVFEGQLKRGPTPKNTYFDEVEISKYIKGQKWTDPFEMLPFKNESESAVSCGYTELLATGPDSFLLIYSDFKYHNKDNEIRKAIKVRKVKVSLKKR